MKEIVPFLAFDGNCREAMTFYRESLGAELFLLPYRDAPMGENSDRILHATLTTGSLRLMAADIPSGAPYQRGTDFSVMLHCESLAEMESVFSALGRSGTVTMPLQDTFWGARFGTLTDRFGVRWAFNFAV